MKREKKLISAVLKNLGIKGDEIFHVFFARQAGEIACQESESFLTLWRKDKTITITITKEGDKTGKEDDELFEAEMASSAARVKERVKQRSLSYYVYSI